MVGSGGVGKSALTLQFMYDEVSSLLDDTIFRVPVSWSVRLGQPLRNGVN